MHPPLFKELLAVVEQARQLEQQIQQVLDRDHASEAEIQNLINMVYSIILFIYHDHFALRNVERRRISDLAFGWKVEVCE